MSETILCLCGCGTEIPAINKKGQPARFVSGHNSRVKELHPNWKGGISLQKFTGDKVLCACGCGELIEATYWGQPRKYKIGHNFRLQEKRVCYACGSDKSRIGRCKVDGKYYTVPYWYANPPIGYICYPCFEVIFRKDKNRERMKNRRESIPNFYEIYERERNLRYKREHDNRMIIVMALGTQCICKKVDCWHGGKCPVADARAIELDHIFGNGKQHRAEYQELHTRMYAYYAKHLDEAKEVFQPLCIICNRIKGKKVADYRE